MEQIEVTPNKHARLAPSAAKRWFICPASVDREAKYPDEDTPQSLRGTKGHLALSELVLQHINEEPDADCPTYDDIRETDPEMREMVDQAFDYVLMRQKVLAPAAVRSEVLVDPGAVIGRDDCYGTADILIISNKVLEIMDFKTGGWLIPPDDPQLLAYAVGAYDQYKDANGKHFPFEKIRLTIFQPRRPGQDAIERYIEMSPADLMTWCEDQFRVKCDTTDGDVVVEDGKPVGLIDPPATPDEEACKFCKARHDCPELAASMASAMDSLTGGTGVADLLFSSETVDSLSVDQLAALLDVKPMIEARFKDASERARKLLEARERVPGWKLVRGKSNRQWALEEPEIIKKLKNQKLKTDQIFNKVLKSPSQVQGLGLPVEKWQSIMKLIVKPEGKLSLVPESDPREDAVPVELFQPVNEVPDFLT